MVCSFFRAGNSGITNWFKESCCRPYESPPPSESGNHQRRWSQPKQQSDFQIEHQHHPGNGSSNGGRDKTTFISPTNKSSKHQNRYMFAKKTYFSSAAEITFPFCNIPTSSSFRVKLRGSLSSRKECVAVASECQVEKGRKTPPITACVYYWLSLRERKEEYF